MTSPDFFSLSVSPDGRFAAMNSTRGLGLLDFTRQITTILPTDKIPVSLISSPVWTPGGQKVGFAAMGRGDANPGGLYQVSVTGTKAPERLTTLGKPRPLISSADPLGPPRIVWVQSSRRILVARPLGTAVAAGPSEIRVVLGFGEDVKARVP